MSGVRDSVAFDVLDAVLALADGLFDPEEVTVSDSSPESFDTGTHLVIGADDWDAGRSKDSATSTQEWATVAPGRQLDETGTVNCMAWAQSGGWGREDVKVARDAVRDVMRAIAQALRGAVASAHGTNVLDVDGLWDIHASGVDRFNQFPTDEGSRAVLAFSIAYQARI